MDIPDLFKNLHWSSTIQRYSRIPFADSKYDGFAIVPRSPESKKLKHLQTNLIEYLEKLDELKLRAPDAYTQRKYSNAGDFISALSNRWQWVVTDNNWITFIKSLRAFISRTRFLRSIILRIGDINFT
jgi:hypothetical protein